MTLRDVRRMSFSDLRDHLRAYYIRLALEGHVTVTPRTINREELELDYSPHMATPTKIADLVARIRFESNTKVLTDARDGMSQMGKAAQKTLTELSGLAKKAGDRLRGMQEGVFHAQAAVKNFGSAAVTAMKAAGDAVYGFASRTATAGDRIAKTARNLAVGVEELQHLEFAAQAGGIRIEEMRLALGKLAENVRAASTGGVTPFTMALADAGLTIADLAGKTRTEQLGIFADVLNDVASEADRTQTAMALLGPELGPKACLRAVGRLGRVSATHRT
ncbi:MAG: hypothetical protein HC814_02140 [Rhodobacteraceae bacterium]|nr:hypothetical protein [Paracoccaceae bacterium]